MMEDDLQYSFYSFNNIVSMYFMATDTENIKVIAYKKKEEIRINVCINDKYWNKLILLIFSYIVCHMQ